MRHTTRRMRYSIDDVVWMISTRPLISKSSSPFNNPLVTVPNVQITINVIIIFYSFTVFSHQLTLMIFHWRMSDICPQVMWTNRTKIIFLLINTQSTLLSGIRWFVYYTITPYEFFTPTFNDGLSQESERQEIY